MANRRNISRRSSASHARLDGTGSFAGHSRPLRSKQIGSVENVRVSHSHARSNRAPSARAQRSALLEAKRRHSRRSIFLTVLCVLVGCVIVASGITAFTYFRSTDANFALKESNAKEALVAQKAHEPYYALLCANLQNPQMAVQPQDAQGYLLMRIDEDAKVVTTITIPARLNVRTSDGATRPLEETHALGGDAELIRAVAGLADISISHFVTTDAFGIKGMVDALGGVRVRLDTEVDDPNAGTQVLFAGEQVLNGSQALVYLRATNVTGGIDGMYTNRMWVTLDLARQAAGTEGFSFANAVGEASRFIYTDWTASDLLSLGSVLKPFSDVTFYQAIVPYTKSNAKGTETLLYERRTKQWASMLERIKKGEDPQLPTDASETVDASTVTVEVRNGTTTAGAGARLGEKLSSEGYKVIAVGNTGDGIVYPETLIIYTKAAAENAAKSVANSMNAGRVVNGGDYYTSSADVIAIIGADYMPVK